LGFIGTDLVERFLKEFEPEEFEPEALVFPEGVGVVLVELRTCL
jgi:hypothetical protein